MTGYNTIHHQRTCLPLLLAGVLAACSGGDTSGGSGSDSGGGSRSGGSGTVVPTTDAIGIWSGTLTPDDAGEPSAAGWLMVGADGNFFLDTDAALYVGKASLPGRSMSATATGHSYRAGFANAAAFTFGTSVSTDGAMTGSYAGAGGGGTLEFHHESAVSRQAASLQAIAGTYRGEIWIQDSMQAVILTVTTAGAVTGATPGGCRLEGTLGIVDAQRNGYHWSGNLSGCAVNGAVSGRGFLIEQSSLYLGGTVQGAAVWIGGGAGDVPQSPAE